MTRERKTGKTGITGMARATIETDEIVLSILYRKNVAVALPRK
jgi:hypothetical protein